MQNLKYLRYVFNDHFVLVLMFLLGFLAYQYAAFQKYAQNWLPGYLIAVVVSILILFIGQLATFVEPADQQFLLAKERAVQAYLKSSIKRSMILLYDCDCDRCIISIATCSSTFLFGIGLGDQLDCDQIWLISQKKLGHLSYMT